MPPVPPSTTSRPPRASSCRSTFWTRWAAASPPWAPAQEIKDAVHSLEGIQVKDLMELLGRVQKLK